MFVGMWGGRGRLTTMARRKGICKGTLPKYINMRFQRRQLKVKVCFKEGCSKINVILLHNFGIIRAIFMCDMSTKRAIHLLHDGISTL